MTDTVARFIRNYLDYKRSKSYREEKYGLLKPLPIPERYWYDISIDFITPLPIYIRYRRNYQHILIVMDKLSKKRKYIPLNSLKVEVVVQAFIK